MSRQSFTADKGASKQTLLQPQMYKSFLTKSGLVAHIGRSEGDVNQ